MEAKAPVRPVDMLAREFSGRLERSLHHGRETCDFSILLADLSWRWSRHEVQINDSRHEIVFQMLSAHVVNLHIHTRARQQEHTVGPIFASVVEVYRVVPVQVRAFWDAVAIARPKCACVVGGVELEVVGVLSKTVKVWVLWQQCPEAEVLILEDERRCRGVEEHFAACFADHTEAERRFLVLKFQLCLVRRHRA